jgi:spermidine synthase
MVYSIKETLYSGYSQEFTGELIVDVKTQYQNIVIINTLLHGNVMLLDGVVQLTEKDEFFYSEMMSHPILLSMDTPKKVLIIGGGDGAIAEECLKHPSVFVKMIEIDPGVIEQSSKYFSSVNGGILSNGHPRFELLIMDGFDFLKNTDEVFDVIITDRPDPIGPGALLFQKEFYALCKARLSERGIMVFQNGVPFYQMSETVETNNILKNLFPHNGFYFGAVPTYVGGQMAYAWAGNIKLVNSLIILGQRLSKVSLDTSYYNASIHSASKVYPPYIVRALG